ncbi:MULTISPECIES: hypothetical protein [unclassified Mesorhizobium]|uniref:hypothetical protein n=1 Tax=unclassified Mesorhizobium TaxID=325217 RepID=UPI003338892B
MLRSSSAFSATNWHVRSSASISGSAPTRRRPASSACTSTVNGHDLREMAVEERREFLGVIPLDIRIQFSQALPMRFDTMPSSPA